MPDSDHLSDRELALLLLGAAEAAAAVLSDGTRMPSDVVRIGRNLTRVAAMARAGLFPDPAKAPPTWHTLGVAGGSEGVG